MWVRGRFELTYTAQSGKKRENCVFERKIEHLFLPATPAVELSSLSLMGNMTEFKEEREDDKIQAMQYCRRARSICNIHTLGSLRDREPEMGEILQHA